VDDNANPCGEFGKRCYCLSEVREIADKLASTDFVIWHLLPAPICQVYELNVDILVIYWPSLIVLDNFLTPTIAEYCG
jgi:hypothetical protein